MDRRTFLVQVSALIALPLVAGAQPAGGVHRIGLLLSTSRATYPARFAQAFEQGLRELGYVEGRNLTIERRFADGNHERLSELAVELVDLKVNVIVAGSDVAALAARNASRTISIVFTAGGDPVGIGLVKSFARPGGNVTGLASFTDVMIGKQLELLRELLPPFGRLAVIRSSNAAAAAKQLAAVREASAALKLQMSLHDVKSVADWEGVSRAIERERPEALQVIPSITTFYLRKRIADFAAAQRLPAIYGVAEYVESGGLISYSFNFSNNWRRTAVYVDRILKGARPADLPVEQPTTLELVINLGTARALGISIPPSILLRANRVIE